MLRSFIIVLNKEYSYLALKRREQFGLRGLPLKDRLREASRKFTSESLEEWAHRRWMYGSDLVINIYTSNRSIQVESSRVG